MAIDPLDNVADQHRDRARGVLSTLQSHFEAMPRGGSFLEREDFQRGFEAFREETRAGADLSAEAVLRAIRVDPRAWVVLRAVAGLSPGEAAYLAIREGDDEGEEIKITQAIAREVDIRCRRGEEVLLEESDSVGLVTRRRHDALEAMATYLPAVISRRRPQVQDDEVHRLDKFDTAGGQETIQDAFQQELYPELLYERILGRPYASHRDSISESVGDLVEMRIEKLLDDHRINFRKSRRREAIPGFPQAPDFLIADRGRALGAAEPEVDVAIEAKLTEDDGTARDKVARIKALRHNEDRRAAAGAQRREIVAVIDGRGFQHRVRDLVDTLEACDGHVYTLAELDKLVEPGGPLHPYLGTSA
ncbi:MAG: hypothetical protein M3355_06250 [Actinomycetota bacterium]|nr:hypothetical protein [Actinomycetota bacterium]